MPDQTVYAWDEEGYRRWSQGLREFEDMYRSRPKLMDERPTVYPLQVPLTNIRVKVTGAKNGSGSLEGLYPGKIVIRSQTHNPSVTVGSGDPQNPEKWEDAELVWIEEINDEALTQDKNYRGDVVGYYEGKPLVQVQKGGGGDLLGRITSAPTAPTWHGPYGVVEVDVDTDGLSFDVTDGVIVDPAGDEPSEAYWHSKHDPDAPYPIPVGTLVLFRPAKEATEADPAGGRFVILTIASHDGVVEFQIPSVYTQDPNSDDCQMIPTAYEDVRITGLPDTAAVESDPGTGGFTGTI